MEPLSSIQCGSQATYSPLTISRRMARKARAGQGGKSGAQMSKTRKSPPAGHGKRVKTPRAPPPPPPQNAAGSRELQRLQGESQKSFESRLERCRGIQEAARQALSAAGTDGAGGIGPGAREGWATEVWCVVARGAHHGDRGRPANPAGRGSRAEDHGRVGSKGSGGCVTVFLGSLGAPRLPLLVAEV